MVQYFSDKAVLCKAEVKLLASCALEWKNSPRPHAEHQDIRSQTDHEVTTNHRYRQRSRNRSHNHTNQNNCCTFFFLIMRKQSVCCCVWTFSKRKQNRFEALNVKHENAPMSHEI